MLESAEALLRVLLDSSLRITIAAAVIGLLLSLFRIRSNTLRHRLWTVVTCAMLLMPALRFWTPSISLPVTRAVPQMYAVVSYLPAPFPPRTVMEPLPVSTYEAEPSIPSVPALIPAPRFVLSWQIVIIAIYLLGTVCFSARLFLGWQATRRLIRDARLIKGQAGPVVYESDLVAVPVTVGVMRPRIILPLDSSSWPVKTLEAILAHERAHVARRDPWTNLIANLNAVLYWFHPLAWWLRTRLATAAEFACDDAAIDATGLDREYAEILVGAAAAVQRKHGRLAWQAIGVHGHGGLSGRIDRILRGHEKTQPSRTRRIVVTVAATAAILVAVACRDQSVSLPAMSDIRLEEQQAAARQAARTSRILDYQRQFAERNGAIITAQKMTSERASALESDVQRNSDDLEARASLIYFYCNSGLATGNRRGHILWMIEHHPDHPVLGLWCSRLNPLPSAHLSDPKGYVAARDLWLAKTQAAATPVAVLDNAAYFFELSDKPRAESLLLRAKAIQPDVKWSLRLGRLYALALAGAVDAETGAVSPDTPAQGVRVFASSDPEANGAFAQSARKKLDQSKDLQLLNSAGQSSMIQGPAYVDIAIKYLQRAVDIDPNFVDAHQRLIQLKARKKDTEIQAVLMKLPVESRFDAVMALPEAQRFPALRVMAVRRYQEANSLDLMDRDQAKAKREDARRYAEALLKLAPSFRRDPGYSGAVFIGDILSGLVAARNGDNSTALSYLHDATAIPISEEMAFWPPFVPYDRLGDLLAGSGHRNDVIAFYEHFAQINLSDRDSLLSSAMKFRNQL